MKRSFSQRVKLDLCNITIKNNCCRRSFLYGYMFASRVFSREAIEMRADSPDTNRCLRALMDDVFGIVCEDGPKLAVKIPSELDRIFGELGENAHNTLNKDAFGCELCRQVFLRGAFVECGTVNAPGRSYHLEFIAPSDGRAEQIAELIAEFGMTPGIVDRPASNSTGVYFKGSEAVEDVLQIIGAQKAAFELMNAKILRELRGNANRCANCDAANISKTVDAAQSQIEAIGRMLASGAEDVPAELLETAKVRIENPNATLAELAALHDPPLTKSGVKHRLDRILKYAN